MSEKNIPTPEVTKKERVYTGFLNIRVDSLKLSHGPTMDYTVLEVGVDAVAILAKTSDNRFVTTREYRHPTGKWLLGCPGGRIDTGESPIEAAKRELLEETGYVGEQYKLLGSTYPFPSATEQKIYYVLVENAVFKQPPALETFEHIHTLLQTREAIEREIASGALVDGVFCTALLMEQICH